MAGLTRAPIKIGGPTYSNTTPYVKKLANGGTMASGMLLPVERAASSGSSAAAKPITAPTPTNIMPAVTGDASPGLTPVNAPPPSFGGIQDAMAGMSASSGGGAEGAALGSEMPGQLRPLGQRMRPLESVVLAGLGKRVY